MPTKANHQTQYHVTEDPYVFCPVCGGKLYNHPERAGQRCSRSDLPPAIGGYCPGILAASGTINRQILQPPDRTASS